jgi:DNA-directed RNA polymerase subunit RPC12/RpoP
MKIQNEEGRELTEEELEKLTGGMYIANYYFECTRCGWQTRKILPEGTNCPECGCKFFDMHPITGEKDGRFF